MGLRKANAYSKKYARPYTRKSKKKSKSYIKTVPLQKVVKFEMGNLEAFKKGDYIFLLRLVSKQDVQIRDNALEAARQVVHKDLELYSLGNYYLAVKKYPHHIYRENRMYSGGSKGERVNDGMRNSFGTAMGRAAFIKEGEDVFVTAFADKKFISVARVAYNKAKSKLPCSTKIVFEMLKK